MSFEVRSTVCYKCPDRKLHERPDGSVYTCHSYCEKYKTETENNQRTKKEFEQRNLGYKLCMDYDFEKCERLNRKYNRRRG